MIRCWYQAAYPERRCPNVATWADAHVPGFYWCDVHKHSDDVGGPLAAVVINDIEILLAEVYDDQGGEA